MKKKITTTILFCAALYSAFVVCGVVFKRFGSSMLHKESGCSGDLYKLARVNLFYQLQPCASNLKNEFETGPDKAELFIFGDSFFNSDSSGEFFKNILSKKEPRQFWNVYESMYPLNELRKVADKIRTNDRKRKLLVFETVERYLFYLTQTTLLNDLSADKVQTNQDEAKKKAHTIQDAEIQQMPLEKKLIHVKRLEFSRYDYFFQNNFIAYPVFSLISTLRFHVFRTFSSGVVSNHYSMTPPMLFLHDDVVYAEMKKSDEMIEKAAAQIKKFQELIREKYDLDLLFIVLPNKYSIYGELADPGFVYDDTIPRLARVLTSKNVDTIDSYGEFTRLRKEHPEEMLYFTGDTHWTPFAREKFAEIVALHLRKKRD